MPDYNRTFTTKINDDTWTFTLITDEEAIELDEEYHDSSAGFRALTILEDKAIFLVEGNVTKGTIMHELFHVAVYYMHLGSADLTTDAFEEVIAVYMENEIDKLIKLRNRVYNKAILLEGAV